MKIGILSDIHANSYALEAVLKMAKKKRIEKLLILGDYIGYYFDPDVVLQMLDEWPCDRIKGNHEHILKDYMKDDPLFRKEITSKYGVGHESSLNKLSSTQIDDLISLPDTKKVVYDDVTFLLTHGSPWDYDHYIYPDSERKVLAKCDIAGIDFVLMGHTHYPFCYRGEHSQIINVGSVGQSRVMGGVANWGIINTENKTYSLQHTIYKTEQLIEETKSQCPQLSYLVNVLTRNRSEL